MSYSNQGRFREQFRFLRRQFLQDGDLPFTDVLSEEIVQQALKTIDFCWRDRIYSPLATLWVFLGQVLSADHSCRAAVAKLIAHRLSNGESACSAETSAYCQARKRLPEQFFSDVARETGSALDKQANADWLWKGRRVYMFDGSTVSMPDTPENQDAYPQPDSQKPGLGFPLARIAAIFSLSCGAVIELGICRYAGKGQGELSLLRRLWDVFIPGDVLLTDRLMCSWREMVMLKQRGIDSVTRLHRRKADFRKGRRSGKGDHIVKWPKPKRKPDSIDLKAWKLLPEYLCVREVKVCVEQPGFRSNKVIVVTTILNTDDISAKDLTDLFRSRWQNEINLKALKQTMQMEILRCKTPELVRKEIWTHILAYNLIRTIIAQAAVRHGLNPNSISFKGTIQTLEAFKPIIAIQGRCHSATRVQLYEQLIDAIAVHRVADRPDRVEPRLRKRRPKHYGFLRKPRRQYRNDYGQTT